jgi:hypothetical protein
MRAGALLGSASNAFPKTMDGQQVVVGFQFPAHLEKFQTPEIQRALTEAIAELLGHAVTVAGEHWPELASAGTATPAKVGGGHLVEEALKQGAQRVDG